MRLRVLSHFHGMHLPGERRSCIAERGDMNTVNLVTEITKVIDNLEDALVMPDAVFSPLDDALESSDDSTKSKFIELLNKAEEKIIALGDKKQNWRISEINLRKGRFARGVYDKAREYLFWKHAYEYAMKADNHEVSVHSSLELGFRVSEKMFCPEWRRMWPRIQGAGSGAYRNIRCFPQHRRRGQRQASLDKTFFPGPLASLNLQHP